MSTQYTQLVAQIAQITHRDDLSPQMANFIGAANELINVRLSLNNEVPTEANTANDILVGYYNLYLYASLISAYEFINEIDMAQHYIGRYENEVERYFITAAGGLSPTLVMGSDPEYTASGTLPAQVAANTAAITANTVAITANTVAIAAINSGGGSGQFDFTAKQLLGEIVSTDLVLADIDFDLSALTSTYDRFIIEGYGRSTSNVGASDIGYIYFNEDLTISNYKSQVIYGRNNIAYSSAANNPQIVGLNNTDPPYSIPDNYGVFKITIENPMASSFVKSAISTGFRVLYPDPFLDMFTQLSGVLSSVTDPITRIRMRTDNDPTHRLVGNFRIYGERQVSIAAVEL